MGNMCCRREVYTPNGTESDQRHCGVHQQQSVIQQQHLSKQQSAMSSAYHSAGDDCAINELLEGRMDLDVLMPDGRQVRLTVERRTPMMDLLVQAASATKISPGGHVIHVFGDGDKGNGTIHYKPSTPIGSLDTKTICIVPKKEASDHLAKKTTKIANRPFEPTFRVQVHLPRNQLTVLRVSPRIKIADLKSMVCKEKGLDTSRYQLVRPSGPTQPLAGDMTLAEYGSTEITLLSNSSIESHICNSTSHIIPYSKRVDESKRKNGILRLLTEDAINKVNEVSNGVSTLRIDSHPEKTGQQEDAHVHQYRYKPKKRRPAPPPPPPVLPEAPSHSRQSSSDSSGYHEATSSFLHEEHSGEEKASSDSSGVSSLDAKVPAMQPSLPPPIPNSKKKKAPAPPPPSRLKEKPTHRQAPACPLSKKINSTTFREPENVEAHVEEHPVHVETTVHQADVLCCNDPSKDSVKDPVVSLQTWESETEDHQRDMLGCNDTSKDSIKDPVVSLQAWESDTTDHQTTKLDACNDPSKDSLKDPVVSLQAWESEASRNTIELSSRRNLSSPTTEFKISTYSATRRNIDPINRVVLEDNLVRKVGNPLTRENNDFVVKDPVLVTGDHIISTDHIIPKDPVSKQNSEAEKKSELHHSWKNEGHWLNLPPQTTVAVKALPDVKAPTTDSAEIGVTQNKNNSSSLVPDTYRKKTPEKKSEQQDLSNCKSEAVSTRVALVALNARIEQDVTQQEIASSIQAAFHSVDFSPQQPSLLAIKQRNSSANARSEKAPALDDSRTTVRVPPLDETPAEREALLIDEDPIPRPVSTACNPAKNLKRSSSLLNFTDSNPRNNVSSFANPRCSRQLQRSLTDLSADGKEDFEAEQQRLQREYIKLQRQFLVWQQQLMNNHAMLREECIVPQYARTLRQSHSLPEGEDSFDETTPSVPLVSRSLSYEPTKDKCSTLPRSAINITSLDFGSIPLSNGTSTLRSSKTKSYFKPPQVRVSTKSRQRLPPEIKREGDVDITDDAKMLTTILPSFESLKLITENYGEDLGVSRLKPSVKSTDDAPTVPLLEGRKVHLSSTFPKVSSRPNNGDRDLKHVNGDTGQSAFQVNCSPKVTEQSPKSQPPPPPPMPMNGNVSKCTVSEGFTKSTGQRNGVGKATFTPHVDPREQLMLEIRKFGGRTALRKISLAS